MTHPNITPAVEAFHTAVYDAIVEHSERITIAEAIQVLSSLASFVVMARVGPSGIDSLEILFARAVKSARGHYQ